MPISNVTPARPVTAAAARRFLVLRHLLAPPRSLPGTLDGVRAAIARLGSLQFDPLEIAGRNHDLVLLARVRDYRRELTDELLYGTRELYEAYNKGLSLLPTSELPWYRVGWDRARARHEDAAFDEHAPLVEELLERIRRDGPMSSRDVEPRAAIDWYWRPTNQVRAILEALAEAGILGIARREGNRRIYDLAERLFPHELLAERHSERDQRRHKLLSRYRGHGLLGQRGQAEVWLGTATSATERLGLQAELVESGALTAVAVESVRGVRFVVTEELSILEQAEREIAEGRSPGGQQPGVALIAPLDPLVWDRALLPQLWGFDYVWEVYVPEPKRRWGYYVLPILWGDRLVGRIEPRIDRAGDRLVIPGLWLEADFDPAEPGFAAALAAALDAHRRFAGVRSVVLPRTRTLAALLAAVRDELGPNPRPRSRARPAARRRLEASRA
ncbi:MAG TPA: crosslink repair DNA glycosylase YcaQ family protein [Candidatus Limnocylindrales bacterium]|nr:crosslink repair DNA glycosylase YcaQ family protein [Candidatus Limnocylindrales bacterium]